MLTLTLVALLAQNPFADEPVKPAGGKKVTAPVTVVLSGKVSQWTGGGPTTSPKESALSGATVVVGAVSLNTGLAGNDTVQGTVAAKAVTNDKGEWTVSVPAGKYSVISWKAGYTPQSDSSVAAPGTHNVSISVDKAGQGLHKSLGFAK